MVKSIIVKHFKCWGVKFETELPAEIIISSHAHSRLIERFNAREDKLKKIVMKAWHSKEVPNYKLKRRIDNRHKKGYKVFRYYLGYIFVFALKNIKGYGFTQKTLVTSFNPKHVQ